MIDVLKQWIKVRFIWMGWFYMVMGTKCAEMCMLTTKSIKHAMGWHRTKGRWERYGYLQMKMVRDQVAVKIQSQDGVLMVGSVQFQDEVQVEWYELKGDVETDTVWP